ncbi:MAG: hypothetical protein EOO63_02155 [Hymenobacter sp.]|nr:MAG: hypothetical protein EOO63_02155 [Hymenobacter sp.]
MWSPEELKTAVPLGQALVAGLFAIGVAVLTWKLTGRRERLKLQQGQQMQHFKFMEGLYTSLLEMVHEGIRYTEARLNYDAYYQSMSTYKLDDFLNTLRSILCLKNFLSGVFCSNSSETPITASAR